MYLEEKEAIAVKNRKKINHKRNGFTLIEMLVVLAILVLLMSLVGPKILGSREKADVNTAKSQIGMLQASLETYNIDMRGYPETEQGLTALVESPSESKQAEKGTKSTSANAGGSKWDGPYVTKSVIPKDPWGNEYQYEFPPTHGKDKSAPNIWSLGPDGEDGSEDDIVSWVEEEGEAGANTTAAAN